MKNFLSSFLGALSAIWATFFLLGLMMVFSLIILAVSGSSNNTAVNVRDKSVLYIDLNAEFTESRQQRDFWGELRGVDTPSLALNDIVNAIESAADDKRIEGIFIDCNGAVAGMAQRQTLSAAINKFKESGKFVYAYGDAYTQGDYFTACAADSIIINPSGMIDIHGLSATQLYFKNLLDKLGVEMQVVKVGTYKSAVEPYILNGPSEASVKQQTEFLNNIWAEVSKVMATRCKVTADKVKQWADSMLMIRDVKFYLKNHIADASMYRREFLKMLEKKTEVDDLRLVPINDYSKAARNPESKGAKIAVYYAEGEIVDKGEQGISAEKMVPALLEIAEDDDIDGLIIRVNSPGGSAFASEQIWDAVQEFKAITGKQVYVSMSDYAASGGYYISCGADKIYAQSLTLTGSIGIFGLIPNAKTLITDKLGVTAHTVSTNPSGDLPNLFTPMTPMQKTQMQAYVERGYELFVKRVADGRHMSVDSVKAIAEGRVWDGRKAKAIGLVDKIGGLDMAIADMVKELNVENYTICTYPRVDLKFWEMLIEMGNQMSAGIENRLIERQLGEAAPLYRQLNAVGSLTPAQARMEFGTINF